MDELALLKEFRLEDAAADGAREHARAALERAMTRRRYVGRRSALVIAFAAAGLLAAGAYAIAHEFIIGAAPPKDVSDEIAYFVGRTSHLPVPGHLRQQVVGEPRVAAGAETSWGPMYLVVARLRSGSACRFRVLPADEPLGPASEVLAGGAECTSPEHPATLWFGLTTVQGGGRDAITLVQGYAPGATRVRIGDVDYETPLGWFLAEYKGPQRLLAYDRDGNVIRRATIGPQ